MGILLQKNDQDQEKPIAFYNKTLRDAPLKYNIIETHAFSLIKALKDFKVYILHSQTIPYVPSIEINDISTQRDPKGRRYKWIVILLEYDLEIKPTKLVKGQGLAKLMTQSNVNFMEINFLDANTGARIGNNEKDICIDYVASPWYTDIIYVLHNFQAPPKLSKSKARSMKLKFAKYYIFDGYLYWKDPGGILLNCLLET